MRHGKQRRRTAAGFVLRLIGSALAVVLVSTAAVGAYAVWDVARDVQPTVDLVSKDGDTPLDLPPDVGAIPGGINLLVVGTDTRTGQGGGYGSLRDSAGLGGSDVTMLLHVSEDHKSAVVVSFPRDLMVPIPSCPRPNGGFYSAMRKQQINSSLSYGGLPCTVLTVAQLVDLEIPFAGMLTFNGVIAMSNAVGGVEVCVANGINDRHAALHLEPGYHSLKGAEALAFLRTRYGVGDGSDLGRIANQQVYLASLVRTMKSAETLSDPAKVWSLAKATLANVTLSSSLNDVTTLYQIAMALKDIDLDKVLFLRYPTITDPSNTNRVIPEFKAADTLFDAIREDRPLYVTGGTGVGAVDENGNKVGPTTDPEVGTDPNAVALPPSVFGQSAEDRTCSRGQG